MKTGLNETWEDYEQQCIPEVPKDTIQYRETKKAFMAGAASMLENIKYISGRFTEDKAEEMLTSIEREIAEWMTEYIVLSSPKRN
jgi:hypothetical protein